MKKFLIGVIFLIPIVVVIALSATGAIIGMTTPVNPQGIVVKNSDNEEIERADVIKIDSKNFNEFIIIDVLPQITQNKGITYERVEEAGEGEIELERMGESNRYSLIPKKIGVTKLEIRAEANVNVYREVTFYVSSDSIEEMHVIGADGTVLGDYLEITESTNLYLDIYPYDALYDNDVTWTSSNPNAVSVSANGRLEVKGRGDARIKAIAVDKDGNTITAQVDVNTEKAVIPSNTVYSTTALSVEKIKESYVFDEEAVVEEIGNNQFSITTEEGVFNLEVVLVEESEWDIAELPNVMYLRNGGYALIASYLASGERVEGTLSFSDSEAFEYVKETDLIIPKKTGVFTISYVADGVTKSRDVVVKDNPIAFELEMGTAEQKLGIQLDRTFGRYWLNDQFELINTYNFGLADKSNTFDVEWSVNDESFATITPTGEGQNVVIDFKEASEGQNVVVTARLKVNNFVNDRVKRSFTFKIREEGNTINVYKFEEAKWIQKFHFYNMALQADIVAPERIEDLTASVFGNGFKWDATNVPLNQMDMDDGALEFDYEDFVWDTRKNEYKTNYEYFVSEGNESIVFEDMIMFNANTLEEAKGRGVAIKSEALWHETRPIFNDFPEKEIPVHFRYLQVYNTHRGIQIGYHYDATVEGCILGDNAETSVFSFYYNENDRRLDIPNKLVFRNNVFKISSGPSIMVASVPIDMNIDSSVNSAPDLRFEGFNDMYNWKTKEEFIQCIAGLIGSYVGMFTDGALKDAIDQFLMPALNDVVKEISKGDEIQDLYYRYAGEDYVSLGALGLGALFYFDATNVTVESENLMLTDLPFRDSEGNPAGRKLASLELLMKKLAPEVGMKNVTTLCNPSAIICTNFSKGEPEIKPGDPIPNSIDLYDKLTGRV